MSKSSLFLFGLLIGSMGLCQAQVVTPKQTPTEHKEEDKVILLSAQVAEQYEQFGISYKRVIGPARFLHNNTLIICDTALWNTQAHVIDAFGNVEVVQENTRLLGESIHYIEELNMGEVRGNVVELIDKDNNRLRTQHLDFNTKDSIGFFFNGGSLVDNKGTILESSTGYFFSKEDKFCFYNHVEMETDTVRIKTDSLYYHTDTNLAEFWGHVQAWHTDGFITAREGTYLREQEYFHFIHDVYIQTDDQEVWAQDVTYDRLNNTAVFLEQVQMKDTTQSLLAFADRVDYRKEPSWLQLTDNPAIAAYEFNKETQRNDTLFIRADTLRVFELTYGTADSLDMAQSLARILPPDTTATPADSTLASVTDTSLIPRADKSLALQADTSLVIQADTSLVIQADTSLVIQADTTQKAAPPKLSYADSVALARTDSLLRVTSHVVDSLSRADHRYIDSALFFADSISLNTIYALNDSLFKSTPIRYIYAFHNVRTFRDDIQALADSMVYNSIDSIVRLYGKPVLWNDASQFSADSIRFRFRKDSLFRADFLSTAFIISQEKDSTIFHQIKSDEMIAHIRNNDVYRFEALSNVKALFYIPEDSIITSLNIKECDNMVVLLKERRAQRITYNKGQGSLKSDMIPLFDLKQEQSQLIDFDWRQRIRPKSRFDITSRTVITETPLPLTEYIEPAFPYTLKYFPTVKRKPGTLRGGVVTNAKDELKVREQENRYAIPPKSIASPTIPTNPTPSDSTAVTIPHTDPATLLKSKPSKPTKPTKPSLTRDINSNTVRKAKLKEAKLDLDL